MGDGISRKTLIEGLAACSSRWTRSELERMEDGRLAACANASEATPEEIRSAAEGGAIARRRADFSPLAENRRDAPRDFSGVGGPNRGASAEGGVETVNVMSGPQGTAAIDHGRDEGRSENAGGDGAGIETKRVMSGPRGTAAVDE